MTQIRSLSRTLQPNLSPGAHRSLGAGALPATAAGGFAGAAPGAQAGARWSGEDGMEMLLEDVGIGKSPRFLLLPDATRQIQTARKPVGRFQPAHSLDDDH